MMVVLGVAIERAVLRPLVNSRRSLCSWRRWASPTSSKARRNCSGARRSTASILASTIRRSQIGGVLISQFDLFAAAVAATMVALLTVVLPLHAHRSRLPRRRRRSVRGARGRAAPAAHLGDRVGGGGLCRSGRGPAVGRAARRAVLAVAGRAQGLPVLVLGGFDSIVGAIVGGLLVGATEKLGRSLIGPFFGGGIENLVRLCRRARLPPRSAGRAVRRKARRKGLRR